jgi:hypothetical protein
MSSASEAKTITFGGFTAVCRRLDDTDGKDYTLIADCTQETKRDGQGGTQVTYRQAVKDVWLPLEQGKGSRTYVIGPVLRLDEMDPSVAGGQVLDFDDHSITGANSFFNPAIPNSTPGDAKLCSITLGEYMGTLFHDIPAADATHAPLEFPVYKSVYGFKTRRASGLSLPRVLRGLVTRISETKEAGSER